jgi:hypothetical protein
MDAQFLADFLIGAGVNTPPPFEQFQTRILTGNPVEQDPLCIQCIADVYKNIEGITTPQQVEAIGTIALCRGSRTDNLNF